MKANGQFHWDILMSEKR